VISIALAVRNGANYLEEGLRSVAAQTYRDYELIICDNASTDATPDIATSHARRDSRIRLVRSEVVWTQAENFTSAVAHCSYPWVKLLCHDDLMTPECLAQISTCIHGLRGDRVALISNGESWLFGSRTWRMSPGSHTQSVWNGKVALKAMAWGRGPTLPAMTTATVRRDIFMQHGAFDRRFNHFDTFYWCHLLITHDLLCLPIELTVNRIHSGQVTVRMRRSLTSVTEYEAFWEEFIRDHAATVGLTRLEAALLKRRASSQLASAASAEYFRCGPRAALRFLMGSPIRWSPLLPPLLVRSFLATRAKVRSANTVGISSRELFP